MVIRSRIGVRRILWWLFYFFVFCFGSLLNTLVFFSFSRSDFNGGLPYAILFLGFSFCVMGILGFVFEYRKIYSVIIDEEKIAISKLGTFYWNDLETVDLYAKKWTGKTYYKGILIKLKRGDDIYLYNYAYSNIKKMREHLQTYFLDKKQDTKVAS